jgi:RND family efflux transporter MFP subunit
MATKTRGKIIRIILYILVGIVILAFIASRIFGNKQQTQYVSVKATVGTVDQTVSLTGTTEPKVRYQLEFQRQGRVHEVQVQAGSTVKAGDVLASLENDDLSYQLASQEAALHIAQANLAKAIAGPRQEDVTLNQYKIELAQDDLNYANENTQNFQDSSVTSVNTAYLAVRQAKLALEKANDAYNYVFQKYQTDSSYSFIPPQAQTSAQTITSTTITPTSSSTSSSTPTSTTTTSTSTQIPQRYIDPYMQYVNQQNANKTLSEAEFAVRQAEDAYNQALEAYDKMASDLNNQSNTLDTSVSKADVALKTAQEQYDLALAKPRDVDIGPIKAQVDQAWQGVHLAEYQFDQSILKAPSDGIVTNVAYHAGENVSLTQPFITLDTNSLTIKAFVSEADIAKMKTGQPVTMNFDAFGTDDSFNGTVSEIDPAETVVQGVVYYEVKVQFDSKGEAVKPGMTANMIVHTESKADALEVPVRAIQYDGDQAYVQVLKQDDQNNQTVEKRNVHLGLQGDENVEVISGLQDGESVVTYTKNT